MAQPARVEGKKKAKLSKEERRALKKQSRNPHAPEHHAVTDGRDGRRERSPDIEPGYAYHDKKQKGSSTRHSGRREDEREERDARGSWPTPRDRNSSRRSRSRSPTGESRRGTSPRGSSRRSRSPRSRRRS